MHGIFLSDSEILRLFHSLTRHRRNRGVHMRLGWERKKKQNVKNAFILWKTLYITCTHISLHTLTISIRANI